MYYLSSLRRLLAGVLLLSTLLAACGRDRLADKPVPVSLNADATGHYCMMGLFEHEGPKAQIHVAGAKDPLWFTQIRDAIAYLRSAEETAEVLAVYVNDMGNARSWAEPGPDNWVDAHAASYVIDSERSGSMGSPEAVPFASEQSAIEFTRKHGGTITGLAGIPDDYVLSAVDLYLLFQQQKATDEILKDKDGTGT